MDLAEVVRRHGPAYLQRHGARLPRSHRRALAAIERCHSAACGGSLYLCTGCGGRRFAWHRCGHRACGQCGHAQGQAWAGRQGERLLPVGYYLVTFTLPEPLRALFRSHQRVCYDLLFKASAAALQEVARQDRRRSGLGGELGLLGVLHTWTRQLAYHPHVHYLAPGVALGAHGHPAWPKDPSFLLPVRRLSARFRRRMREALGNLLPALARSIPAAVWRQPWVVHIQPAGRGRTALDYLSRYIHKTALSSTRLRWQDDRRVCFAYQDRATGRERTLTLSGQAFLHRFLQHVLPKGFRRVRTYGWLSPAARARYEALRALLDAPSHPPRPPRPARVLILCPHCQQPMLRLGELGRAPP